MTRQEQEDFFEKFVESQKELLLKKGSDYSNEDRLSNFKYVGAITGTGSEQSCLNLIATKVARLGQLLQPGRKPNNESIDDTVIDLANYSVLLAMILSERANIPAALFDK